MRQEGPGPLIARCVVCRGDIHEVDRYEVWEEAYYCERHSLLWLRQRARMYAEVIRQEAGADAGS